MVKGFCVSGFIIVKNRVNYNKGKISVVYELIKEKWCKINGYAVVLKIA